MITVLVAVPCAHGILAGDEFGLPEDRPSWRIDAGPSTSSFNSVGAVEMDTGGATYLGSAVALSPHWVLSAGHNVDFNDDGLVDDDLSLNFHLPEIGVFTASSYAIQPNFTGFGNPSILHDLSLIFFAEPLPNTINFPSLGLSMEIGNTLALVGFGRSGYGSYGYTSQADTDNRRLGQNTVESFEFAEGYTEPLLFRYTFNAPEEAASLGNTIETIIGPGDSGGPAFIEFNDQLALVGINTFTEGYGGRFGDIGGGVVLEPYWEWISETTDLALIPEPEIAALLIALGALLFTLRRRNATGRNK